MSEDDGHMAGRRGGRFSNQSKHTLLILPCALHISLLKDLFKIIFIRFNCIKLSGFVRCAFIKILSQFR